MPPTSDLPAYLVPLSEDGSELLSFAPVPHTGWAAYFAGPTDGQDAARVFLRVGPRSAEQPVLEIRELQVMASVAGDLGSSLLRRLPFDRIEAAVNHRRHRDTLAQYVQPWNTVRDSDFPVPHARHAGWLYPPAAPVPNERPVLRIEADPAWRRRPDSFYADVADRFLWLVSIGKNAAQELADANGVPLTTVRRWIREARDRGVLIAPTPG